MSQERWLLFLPQLPSVPSSLRVAVWRRLRAWGATGLQNGVWVLPFDPKNVRLLEELLGEVKAQGGSGLLMQASPLDATFNEEIVERFRADRDQEYSEFCERGIALLAELAKETQRHKLTFAELEENEQDLHKLTGWLEKITARDYFGASQAGQARSTLVECQQALAAFAQAIYQQEGLATED
jgi:hypothetical protein